MAIDTEQKNSCSSMSHCFKTWSYEHYGCSYHMGLTEMASHSHFYKDPVMVSTTEIEGRVFYNSIPE